MSFQNKFKIQILFGTDWASIVNLVHTTFLKQTLVEKLKLLLPFLFRCCIFFSVWTFQGCYRKSLTTWQHTYPGQYVPSRQEPCLPSPLQIFTPHCQSSNNYWSAIYNFGAYIKVIKFLRNLNVFFLAIFVSIFSKERRK